MKGSRAWKKSELFIANRNDEKVFGLAFCYYASLVWFIIWCPVGERWL